jgi:NAD(P)-dependent dehydrogenase (short-subunit alcohol dehydrogenase family)
MDDFAGRVAVVTGAASGIGRGLARHAATEGMRVVLADVEAAALDDAVADVRQLGADAVGVRTDVSRAEDVEALADQTFERFGSADLVCNNAGVFQAGVVWQRTQADWDWVVGVNVWGILHGIRAFVPRMLEQGTDGHIVNTASMAGLISVAYSGPYVVSKFAAAALTECLAHDLRAHGSGIGVSCLVPGLVDTRIADSTRNRPDEPPSEVTAPDHHFVAQVLKEQTSTGGRHPDEVAAIVFDAVRAGQFWIPTTDGFEPLIRRRYDALLDRAMPPPADFD